MPKRLAVFGGSFNPPALHHRAIAVELSKRFDEVVIVPCGPRDDKPKTKDVEPIARATMVDMCFRNVERVRVELFDIEQATFTRTHALEEHFRRGGEVWHVVSDELIRGGKTGSSFVQEKWERGDWIWRNLRFAVVVRKHSSVDKDDLPPRSEVITSGQMSSLAGSGLAIREKIFRHESVEGFVTAEVADYIERYGLYRGALPARSTAFRLQTPRLLILSDESNEEARAIEKKFAPYAVGQEPNCLLIIGGDGTMLHGIRKYWRLRLPFLGINAGHRGFLLNGADELLNGFPQSNLTIRQSPLLYLETLPVGGGENGWEKTLAFNDAWAERATGQAAWIEVKVNGQVRLPHLVADGILLSTAAGSTAYARAMGATPLLVETPALILVGSNTMEPPNWTSALLSFDSEVEIRTLDPDKRPLMGFADGIPQGRIERMRARVSRIAAVELAFCRGHDMAEKIAEIQFPLQPVP
jgi:NAD+ kinase